MSISETLLARERTDGSKWDWSALPVFLSPWHHWPYLYVNTGSGIARLADMKGKRVGVPDYDMTAALWFRIVLKDLYGIEAKDNVCFNGRTKELSHGGALRLDKAGPVGIEHHWLTAEQTLDQMLDRGEIDACTAIRPQSCVTAGNPTVIDRWGGRKSVVTPDCASCAKTTAKRSFSNIIARPGFSRPTTMSSCRIAFCASTYGWRWNCTTRFSDPKKVSVAARGGVSGRSAVSAAVQLRWPSGPIG
jgi:hypothetical protein